MPTGTRSFQHVNKLFFIINVSRNLRMRVRSAGTRVASRPALRRRKVRFSPALLKSTVRSLPCSSFPKKVFHLFRIPSAPKESVSWIPKEKALMRMVRNCRRDLPARKVRIVSALPIRCRSCSVAYLLPVFDTAPAAAPRRAAVQAPIWLRESRMISVSAAAALGADPFKSRTPETEECTEVCSGFFFWGHPKPRFLL